MLATRFTGKETEKLLYKRGAFNIELICVSFLNFNFDAIIYGRKQYSRI